MGRAKIVRYIKCAAVGLCVLAVCSAAYAAMVDKVIVVVNDEVVTQREFDRMFVPVKQSYEANFKGPELERRVETARKGLLEQLINSKLAVSLAKKAKMKVNEDDLQQRIDNVKSYYKTEEEFLQALDDKGTNLTEFKKEIRDQMLAQELVQKEVASKIVIAPGDLQELYDKNKDKLVAPHTVKVRGIMIRKPEVAGDDTGRKKMEVIVKDLKSGKDFATVAKEKSEGPYGQNGGDMGYVPKGQTLPEIDNAIFALKKGEMSEMIESPVGYHVFLAEDIKEPRPLEFEEVSEFLRQQLYGKRFQEELVVWLEEKRKDAYISYK
ncbi:MAG: peptidylprolyl isomerase [Candidatus Omnitrophota bacterium]